MTFWNQRYAEPGWAYGQQPNDFVRAMADQIPAGPVLCLGSGEGRNAVYLAGLGHAVTAVDASTVGLEKTRRLAAEAGVVVTTIAEDLDTFSIAPGAWSGIVAIFLHLPPPLRRRVHAAAATGLAEGGVMLIEAYRPEQLALGTGGPPVREMLVTVADLREDLAGLHLEVAREVERDVTEGRYHTGKAATAQVLARR